MTRTWLPVAGLVAVRLALGLAYSQVVPTWEAYDEDGHFAYARYLAVHQSMVLRPDDPEAAAIWERFQPPLYYNLIAPIIAGFDLGDSFAGPPLNPYFINGDAGYNYALHPRALTPSAQSVAAAVSAARAASALLSSLSVIFVYFAARRVWPQARGAQLAATSLFAFWPQWVFVGSMVSNDGLVTTLAALGLWLAVRLVTSGFRVRWVLALAATVGLALLAKLNGLALVPTALAAGALSLTPRLGRRARLRPWQLAAGLLALAAGVAAAFWVLTSLDFVTGQVLQAATLNEFFHNLNPAGGGRPSDLIASALPYAFRTFWASFGWGNLETAPWLYRLWEAGALAALAGLALAMVGRRVTTALQARLYWLFGLHVVALLALTLALAIAHQNEFLVPGRYLLPTLPAVALLLVGGWRELAVGRRLRTAERRGWQAVSAGVLLIAWAIPIWTLLPAYARPTPLSVAAAGGLEPQTYFFNGQIELLGYSFPERVVAGRPAALRLCWQAVTLIEADYTVFLEIVGPDNLGYGRLLTFPGHGNYPTTSWPLSRPFCDTYTLPVQAGLPAPSLAHVRVSVLRPDGDALPVADINGAGLPEPEVYLEFKANPAPGAAPAVAHVVDYRFGSAIRLTGYTLDLAGPRPMVTLRWEALADGGANDVVFVHLRDTPETRYAQGDSLPLSGAYPTWLWRRGEVVLDPHPIELPTDRPAPRVDLYVGLFDAVSQERVPVFDAAGQRAPNDEVILETGISLP
ncbi:MAG: glycosyltransferase family 39 protein [Anaerolineales bacterium]|nr:glycosyltransferase family 39 protein [Anaerolineales bacterium]